jgi:hypothetical protein
LILVTGECAAGDAVGYGFFRLGQTAGQDRKVKIVKRIGLILVILAALVYAGDYAVVRIPIPRSRTVFNTVTVRPYLAVGLKSGKSDLYFLDPRKETCINSLFPHLGHNPCWYVRKHTRQRIAM